GNHFCSHSPHRHSVFQNRWLTGEKTARPGKGYMIDFSCPRECTPVRGKGCARLEFQTDNPDQWTVFQPAKADTGLMEGSLMSSPTDPKTRLNLEQQRKRAKDLLRAHRSGNLDAAVRVVKYLPRARNDSPEQVLTTAITLSEAQFIIAREAGFSSWPKMKHQLEESVAQEDLAGVVIDAALAGNEDLVRRTLLKDSGGILRSIHAACAAGDADAAVALLESNPQLANDRGGKRNWTPLLYLCCNRYRRNDA